MIDALTSGKSPSKERSVNIDRFPWIILLVSFVILLPELAFPFGQDHSTFVRGGRTIFSGGTLYVDFIDVKPPLLYILYGIADWITGGSVILIRLCDILFQLTAVAMMLRILQHATSNRLWLWGTAVVYSVLYSILGYSQVGQAESFCSVLIVAAIWCAQQRSGTKRWLVLAVAMTFAFMLKYPLAAIGPAAMAVWLVRDGLRPSVRAVGAGMLAFIGLSLLAFTPFLLQDGFVGGLNLTIDYLRVYGSEPPLGIVFVTDSAKSLGAFFAYTLSTTFTITTVVGAAVLSFRKDKSNESAILISALWMTLILSVTIVIERKFSPYHFERLFIPISILSGAGIALWPEVREHLRRAPREIRWALVSALIVVVLVFSPFTRYANVVQLAIRSIGDTRPYDEYLTRPREPGFDFTAIRTLKNDLLGRLAPTDTVMLMSMMATPILVDLPTRHTSSFVDSHVYFGRGARDQWRLRAAHELLSSKWVVVDTIDECEGVNLHKFTSWQSLQRDTLLLPIITEHFSRVDTVACFFIYRRNGS